MTSFLFELSAELLLKKVSKVQVLIDALDWIYFISQIGGALVLTRSAQNRLATIRLPYAGPTTGLKSAKCRLYERRLLADFRPVVGPAYGSRMVANQIRADRGINTCSRTLFFKSLKVKSKERENKE